MSEAQSPFIAGTNIQFAWDATSLTLVKECARKYYYSMICGWSPRGESIHLKFGIILHKALETHAKLVAQGISYDDALDQVVSLVLNETWERLDTPEGLVERPWDSMDSYKNRDTLVRSVVWWLEHYRNDPAKVFILDSGAAACELSFKMEMPFQGVDGDDYLYCGHMDRVVTYGEDLFIMDHKTTKTTPGAYYFHQYNPHTQMSGYTAAGKIIYDMPISGVIIDAIQIAVGFTAFSRGITTRSAGQINEFLDNTVSWFKVAQRYAEEDTWPMNESSCNNYGECPFRKVCSQDAAVRDKFLETYFEKRQWNPLEER